MIVIATYRGYMHGMLRIAQHADQKSIPLEDVVATLVRYNPCEAIQGSRNGGLCEMMMARKKLKTTKKLS